MSQTLSSIVSTVCSTVQKLDTASQTLCQTYVQNNYLMIWEKFNWIDAQTTATVSLTAGTNYVLVPSNIELVTMVIWNTYPLRNADLNNMFRWRPQWQTDTGSPTFYINLPKLNGQCQFQLDASPTITENVIIVGKSTFTQLSSGTSTPLLRGITNTLIAFTEGDMLKYLRLYGSANIAYQKAQAMLQEMIDLENQQQTTLKQLIPIKMDWDLNDLVTSSQGINNDTYFLRGV